MLEIFWFFMGVMCTFSLLILIRKRENKNLYITPFVDILKCASDNKLTFKHRLQDLVYLTGYKDTELIYNLDRCTISVFENNNCILVSNDLNKYITDEIIDIIELNFYDEIYENVGLMNGSIYSNNYIDLNLIEIEPNENPANTKEPMIEFLVDEDDNSIENYNYEDKMDKILYKLKKFGINSLTNNEKEFINNIDNWQM